jgi:hypothetical protein
VLLRPLSNFLFLSQQNDLAHAADGCYDIEQRLFTDAITLHQDVVQKKRTGFASSHKEIRKHDP